MTYLHTLLLQIYTIVRIFFGHPDLQNARIQFTLRSQYYSEKLCVRQGYTKAHYWYKKSANLVVCFYEYYVCFSEKLRSLSI